MGLTVPGKAFRQCRHPVHLAVPLSGQHGSGPNGLPALFNCAVSGGLRRYGAIEKPPGITIQIAEMIDQPSTDLYLMGRQHRSNQDSFRGVVPAHKLVELGVNCSLSNNNVLNPFTPYGDCSLVHAANLYANICHAGDRHDVNCCFDMITRHPAKLMRIDAYGIGIGKAADLIVLDTDTPDGAIREVAQVLYAFKAGRKTVTRPRATLHRPVDSDF